MNIPFDGAIRTFFENDISPEIRTQVQNSGANDMLDPDYPYRKRLKRSAYEAELHALQIELVKFQAWIRDAGQRAVVVFEGRDAAGKGGTIKRVRENLNPRVAKIIALSKPSEAELGQWYFQRYIQHLPTTGHVTLFDRSWYNRGVVEHVFGFCTPEQRERFFTQVPEFEKMITEDGTRLIKIWLNVGRAEQLRRFLDRESDPLKQWKLSSIDVKGLSRWDAYSQAIGETIRASHTQEAPWTVIRSDDKRRARLQAIKAILSQFDYAQKDVSLVENIDPRITGGPELFYE